MRGSPPGSRYEIPDTQMADEKQLEILQDKANFRSFKPKPFNMREFYDRAGHDIRDMLLSCQFRGEVCSAEDFKVVSESPGAECEACESAGGPQRRRRLGADSLLILLAPLGEEAMCPWGSQGILFSMGVHLFCVRAGASALCPCYDNKENPQCTAHTGTHTAWHGLDPIKLTVCATGVRAGGKG